MFVVSPFPLKKVTLDTDRFDQLTYLQWQSLYQLLYDCHDDYNSGATSALSKEHNEKGFETVCFILDLPVPEAIPTTTDTNERGNTEMPWHKPKSDDEINFWVSLVKAIRTDTTDEAGNMIQERFKFTYSETTALIKQLHQAANGI